MNSMLNQKRALAKLRTEIGESVGDVESLGTWPITAETKKEKRRGRQFPKISLRC